jgi:esterase/lipase
MLQAFRLLRNAAPSISCPILALHGERDEICPLDAIKALLDTQVTSTDKTLKTWPDGVHVMLHDPEEPEVLAAIWDWMHSRLTDQTDEEEAAAGGETN